MDYPISSLVGLRTLCQEAGGYQVGCLIAACLPAASCVLGGWTCRDGGS